MVCKIIHYDVTIYVSVASLMISDLSSKPVFQLETRYEKPLKSYFWLEKSKITLILAFSNCVVQPHGFTMWKTPKNVKCYGIVHIMQHTMPFQRVNNTDGSECTSVQWQMYFHATTETEEPLHCPCHE